MMGTQGPGRKRIPNRDKMTAEDDALNQIAREAEARLAAKRAARAEAREIRMKELERQQKEEDSERYSRLSRRNTSVSDDDEKMSVCSRGSCRPSEHGMFLGSASRASSRTSSARASPVVEEKPDRDFLDKGSRTALTLSASTLASLGGASSRRGSCDTSFSVETEASIREIKDSLAEAEERYRRAMVSNAQLHNEKSCLMYQVETLKEELSDMEEQLWEARQHCGDTTKELERERQSHSFLQFQFKEMKDTLRKTEEMLTEVSELRLQSSSYCQEVSDLQEVLQWKQKKIAALEREREISDIVRIERDRLRDEATQLRDLLKKHGVVVSSEISTNGETGQTEADVITDSGILLAQDWCHGSRESMLGKTGARCPAWGSKLQQDDMKKKSWRIFKRSQSLNCLSDEQTERDTSYEGVKKQVKDKKKERTQQMKRGSSVTRLNDHVFKPEFTSSPQGVLVTENQRSFKLRRTDEGGNRSFASHLERNKKRDELFSLVRRTSTKQIVEAGLVSTRAANKRSNLTRKRTYKIQRKQKHIKGSVMSDFTQTCSSAVGSQDTDIKTKSEEQSSGDDESNVKASRSEEKKRKKMIRRENKFINTSSEIQVDDSSENETVEVTDKICHLSKNSGGTEQTVAHLIREFVHNHKFLSEISGSVTGNQTTLKDSTQEEETQEEPEEENKVQLTSVSAATHKLTHHDSFNISRQSRSEVKRTSSPEETCNDQREGHTLTTSCCFEFVFVESHFAEPQDTRSAESPQSSGDVTTETNGQMEVASECHSCCVKDVKLRRTLSTNCHEDQSSKIRRIIETTADKIKTIVFTEFMMTSFREGRIDEDQQVEASPRSSPDHADETMKGGETLVEGVESCEEADEEAVTQQHRPMMDIVIENVEVVIVGSSVKNKKQETDCWIS
ncbi:leucine-rich repeat flightless-interacting protein 1 isoform X3 [Paralichthys olivaceus]|uniref:leucine-rich repeat flightless-interacting protein 1 isoform X3 n=1 Tax=Paralichthys olivaceus TaxID=8255 RepID=UPI003751F103